MAERGSCIWPVKNVVLYLKTCGMCGINSCCWPPAPGVTADSLSTVHTHDLFTCHSQVPLISGHKAQVKDRFLPHQRIVKSACSGHFTSFERGTRCRLSTIHHPLALPFVQPLRVHPACCPLHSGCLASGPKTNGFTEPHHWPSRDLRIAVDNLKRDRGVESSRRPASSPRICMDFAALLFAVHSVFWARAK